MQSIIPNDRVVKQLSANLFTPEDQLQQGLWRGVLALTASQFQAIVGRELGANAVYVLDQFYANFLGMFKHVAVDYRERRIRFFNEVSDFAVDGVELWLAEQGATLYQLSGVCGVTSSQVKQTYKY